MDSMFKGFRFHLTSSGCMINHIKPLVLFLNRDIHNRCTINKITIRTFKNQPLLVSKSIYIWIVCLNVLDLIYH